MIKLRFPCYDSCVSIWFNVIGGTDLLFGLRPDCRTGFISYPTCKKGIGLVSARSQPYHMTPDTSFDMAGQKKF